jgi:hypothetical protein
VSNVIEIRGEGAQVALEIVEFERPNSTNVDDANWLVGRLNVVLKHFSCQMGVSLRTYELTGLQSELRSCLRALDGTARLRPLGPELQLDLAFDRRGHVSVAGVVQTPGPHKTTLSFSFDSDQSYLAQTDRQLQATLLNFPVRTT